MAHDISWKSLTPEFIAQIAHIVVSETLVTICRPATAILIKIVCAERASPPYAPNNDHVVVGYPAIHEVLQQEPELLPTLVQRLQSPDYSLCLNSLTLLASMLKHVTDEHRSELLEALDKNSAYKNVLVL